MDNLTRELERAVWHVDLATKIIGRQLTLAQALRGMGYTAAQATESKLDAFVSALEALEDHERLLRDEIVPRNYLRQDELKRRDAAIDAKLRAGLDDGSPATVSPDASLYQPAWIW